MAERGMMDDGGMRDGYDWRMRKEIMSEGGMGLFLVLESLG